MLRAVALFLLFCATARAEPLSPELVAALRQGGHAIFFRHAFADEGIDQDPKTLGPCTMQRRLSPKGRGQAQAIGAAFAALGIPVGHVASSPYCRAKETVAIAFGPMQVDHRLRLWQGELTEQEKIELPQAVKRMLGAAPARGNTVLVSHNSKDALGIDLDQGEAAVVAPRGGEAFEVLAKIKPGEWLPQAKVADQAPPPEWVVAEYPLPGSPLFMKATPNDGVAVRLTSGAHLELDSRIGRSFAGKTKGPWPPSHIAARDFVARDGTRWRISAGGSVSADGVELPLPAGAAPVNGALLSTSGGLWLSRPSRNAVLLIRRP